MARARSNTATLTREGHSISLKVLRLSRPSLAQQTPVSKSNIAGIPQISSLALPSASLDGEFLLSPILTLPPSFGSTHVGETFSCAIVANNELDGSDSNKSISGLKFAAEMKTPSQTFPLQLYASADAEDAELSEQPKWQIPPGSSIQRIVEFPLREEGNHTLIIGISYDEVLKTPASEQEERTGKGQQYQSSASHSASPNEQAVPSQTSRTRTFRKMYQFPTTPCLSVRTKSTELPPYEISERSLGDPYARTSLLRYALEAQLENVSETRITLETATLIARPPFQALGLNEGLSPVRPSPSSDDSQEDENQDEQNSANGKRKSLQSDMVAKDQKQQQEQKIVLQPRSIHQLLFHVAQQPNTTAGLDEMKACLKTDGRTVLGQIALEWRSAMGEKGALSTGNLMTRRKQ